MAHHLTIQATEQLAHNVNQYDLEKPDGYTFEPGQATEVSIAKPDWDDQKRPFTFTRLPDADRLQFMIKSYPDHNGVTEQLSKLVAGDTLNLDEPFGTIAYKGPGVFIAGGAGITPFVAILRKLQRDGDLANHRLLLANRRERDIFPTSALQSMHELEVIHILSEETGTDHLNGRIDRDFLADNVDDFSQRFYVCGPPDMVKDINAALEDLGADPDGLVFEK
jgi:ferredoxin-NADP reductase